MKWLWSGALKNKKRRPHAAGALVEFEMRAMLIGIDTRAKNSRGFEGDDPSGVERKFAASLRISSAAGFFIFDIEFAKSAQE